MKNVVVIGAGITGMRIADLLAKSGFNVTILEKTNKVGGMTASFKYNDFILDYGPHKFYTQLPGIYDDFKEIVGEGNYLSVKKKNSIRLLGKYFDFPVKLSQLLFGINPVLSIKIGLDLLKANLNKRTVISYEDYFINGFGQTGYNIVMKGFAEKVWGNPQNLSEELARRRSPAKSIFEVLKTTIIKNKKDVNAEYFLYPKYGYGVICDNLLKSIKKNKGKMIFGAITQKINIKDKKVNSLTVKINGKTKKISCDILVPSISIDDLSFLINPKPNEEILKKSKNLKFRSIIISYIFLKKKLALKDNWLFFPEKDFCFNRVAEQKSFSPFTCPEDKTVLTAEITCDYGDSTYNLSDEEIKEKVINDLIKANLIRKEDVYDFFTKKAGRVYPVYNIGYKENLNKVLDYLDTIENIFPVGRPGLFNYNNADHCLDMANVVSKIIINKQSREDWKKARLYFDSYKIVD